MTRKAKTQLVALDDIRTDGGTQMREEIDITTVEEYAQCIHDGDEFPPCDVFWDGVAYWLADGFHRYHANRKADRVKMDCIVHEGTKRDAVLFAIGANAQHGMRRTHADKRKAVDALLRDEEWSKWSDRVVAEKAGVGHSMVSYRRAELSKMDSSPTQTKGADGKTRTRKPPEQKKTPERQSQSASDPEEDDASESQTEESPEDTTQKEPPSFSLNIARARLDNAITAELESWPREHWPVAADCLEDRAMEIRQ